MSRPFPASGKCRELLDKFKIFFPEYGQLVKFYQPYDRSSIRITINNRTYIFTYIDDKNWGFVTERNYLDMARSIKR